MIYNKNVKQCVGPHILTQSSDHNYTLCWKTGK